MLSIKNKLAHAGLTLMLGASLLWSASVVAAEDGAEKRLTIGAGGAYLDNVRHTATGQEDEIVGIATVDFQLRESRPRLEADLRGTFNYEQYSSSTYGGELFGDFSGVSVLKLRPERFHWYISDDYADIRSRIADADTPDAREHLNYFSTGPDLLLGLGTRTVLSASGRFSDTRYSESSEFDSQRLGGRVVVQRQLTPLSSIALNAERSVLEFAERASNPDIHQEAAYVRYLVQGARTELNLDAGYSRAEQQRGGEKRKGSMLRVSLVRDVTARSTLELSAGRIFTDAGDFLRLTEHRNFSNIDTQTIVPTANIFDSRHGSLLWTTTRGRTMLRMLAEYHDERYSNAPTPFDRTRGTVRMQTQRRLSERMIVGIGGYYSYEDYENQDLRGDWTGGNLSLDWALTRQLATNLEYTHGVRHSSRPEYRYTENRVWLRLIYNPLARR